MILFIKKLFPSYFKKGIKNEFNFHNNKSNKINYKYN